jgi:hypothetical protein
MQKDAPQCFVVLTLKYEQDNLKRLPESFALGIPSRETQEKETDWKQLVVS